MEEERIYTIPLRDVTNKSPTTKRAPRAIRAIRAFLMKHMKSDVVKLDNSINEKVWERSLNKIPAKVRVKAVKEGDVVKATLIE
ncbi:Ribosomal protein L31e [Methanococcus vannielii SB]|jgi:large subunit ribosomal protein L31e|uniref:Large ribosomal subunit protein eL31 n=1 Tax=Methanococcus vannielii (strain ATCC 35089 / DSM 1224 / JCM 13029 / OCM 148 / SB) TaxID=406327 RepID=RL31_METVS|nr:50S ribosomal protein L31e [Methanococcus vannielii]A6UR55.1 RecName: Full=Large ribosomal subunit protein eL31; AltName: Full=50S ribosomal protein L31e [Methanococcus vannielii SB]ABR54977.1 Ribosomal protein L31e [Methanococcus vannielii SB]